jgi:hypothetical protein
MAFMGLAERRGYRQKERKEVGVMAFMGLAERRGYRQRGFLQVYHRWFYLFVFSHILEASVGSL